MDERSAFLIHRALFIHEGYSIAFMKGGGAERAGMVSTSAYEISSGLY